jgi:hypothetical protein
MVNRSVFMFIALFVSDFSVFLKIYLFLSVTNKFSVNRRKWTGFIDFHDNQEVLSIFESMII